MYRLEATDIGFDEEDDALTVSFGGVPDADGYPTIHLLLQRSTDENEDEPGIEGVYVEWRDQRMSGYGCINRFDLYPERARVIFTEGADFYVAEDAGKSSDEQKLTELVVTFKLDEEIFKDLKQKLFFIFKGCDCYAVPDVDGPTSA